MGERRGPELEEPTPHAQLVALVTGANRGIGREVAKQLAKRHIAVYAGSRDLQRGRSAAKSLAEENVHVTPLQIDVTDVLSVESAFLAIEEARGRLDILVNNAGRFIGNATTDVNAAEMREIYEVNVFGVVTVMRTFLPLLRLSKRPRVVNVSSTTASLALTSDDAPIPGDAAQRLAYASSKAALNMLTLQYAKAFRRNPDLSHIKVNSATPGYTATEMNQFTGERSVEQAARVIVKLATLPDQGPTGQFHADDGATPW